MNLKDSVFIFLFIIPVLILQGCQNQSIDAVIDFDSADIISTVDYSDKENWAYSGIGEADIDLFLICPTVFGGDEQTFNMPIDDSKSRERFIGALNMERGIYEDSCKMYAPFYRQAAFTAYASSDYEDLDCFDTAYNDIKSAFIHYMKNKNNGRPFILAGFSQGSDMALRLMKEFFVRDDINQQLVAAYLIGWRITPRDLATHPYLKMAESEDDTGVIISFNTEAETVTNSIIVPETTYGINPLNWKTDDAYAPALLNKGACFTDYSGNITREIPHFTGAYLDPVRGVLKVTDVDLHEYPSGLEIFGEGVYHIYDYQFFYRNLQENVAVRTAEFLK